MEKSLEIFHLVIKLKKKRVCHIIIKIKKTFKKQTPEEIRSIIKGLVVDVRNCLK